MSEYGTVRNKEFKFKVGDECMREDGSIIIIDDLPDEYTRVNFTSKDGGGGWMGYNHWKRLVAV